MTNEATQQETEETWSPAGKPLNHLTLAAWMERRGLANQYKTAELLGLFPQTVSGILNGKGVSLKTALLIEQRTGGQVPAWVHLPKEDREEIYGRRGRP